MKIVNKNIEVRIYPLKEDIWILNIHIFKFIKLKIDFKIFLQKSNKISTKLPYKKNNWSDIELSIMWEDQAFIIP